MQKSLEMGILVEKTSGQSSLQKVLWKFFSIKNYIQKALRRTFGWYSMQKLEKAILVEKNPGQSSLQGSSLEVFQYIGDLKKELLYRETPKKVFSIQKKDIMRVFYEENTTKRKEEKTFQKVFFSMSRRSSKSFLYKKNATKMSSTQKRSYKQKIF